MNPKQDDLKWFGEGFDGFPKALPEDCAEYTIYIIDSNLKDLELRNQLREVQSAATRLTKKLLKGFIWQREEFQLLLEREGARNFLRGRTNFGDSVTDEWLIVYILRELSKQFPQTWTRVVDTDGQFLLSEAANALPLWLNPEIADFRVWINNGKLLIIPLDKPGGKCSTINSESDELDLDAAFFCLEKAQPRLLHSPKMETEAFYRLRNYPQQIPDSLHHAVVRIPRKLAYLLHKDVSYISPAVEAFYLRDLVALRPLQTKNYSALHFGPMDFVSMSVAFTRVGYAQLKSQQFEVPASWVTATINAKSVDKSKAEMGMKICCGFEMLMSDPHNKDMKAVREIKLFLDDLKEEEASLPSDTDVRNWGMQEDDESWLDIDFEDFERELDGKARGSSLGGGTGFGDKGAQESLRKMVAKFEEFLEDDSAGAEGAEHDEMDDDDDEDSDQDGSSTEDLDAEIESMDEEFDEDEFSSMMREMMGMPPGVMKELMEGKPKRTRKSQDTNLNHNLKTADRRADAVSSSSDEGEGICQAMAETEKELREAGALTLDPNEEDTVLSLKVTGPIFQRMNEPPTLEADTDVSGVQKAESRNHQYNLAKNVLESFKSQGGMSGPAGNLMGLMNVHMPRDASEEWRGSRHPT